ncbi:hypothetical protein QJQ45_026229 [Haematococcus lacustris]|nr:hypothetical protein QJQ45_026229 [Haematococcus lacustris]
MCRGLPGDGENTRPSAAVAAVLAAHPDIRARLEAIPRYLSDTNMVDHVGKQLQSGAPNMGLTAFGNILTLLFAGRLKKSVSLAGAKVLLGHSTSTSADLGETEAAMAAWQLDMVPWQQSEPTNLLTRPPRPPTPYALTPTSKCQARHIFIDTRGLYGLMRDAGMLGVLTEQGVTSLPKFRNGALPDSAKPGHYIEGPNKRPELPLMSKGMGAVNPLAHLHAEWLGVDPGKTVATVAHEERDADGNVVSVWQRTLTAVQYYRDSGITRQAQATKTWLASVKPQLTALSRVSSKPSSLALYRRFADTVLATYNAMWAEVSKPR